jgi:hypothetical protein
LTDDLRCESELRSLLETACERQYLIKSKDFWITYRELDAGYGYFDYFTKYGYSDKVILFRKDTGLQKFYQIGKWFEKSKKQIWQEYILERYGTTSPQPILSVISENLYREELKRKQQIWCDFNRRMLSGKYDESDEARWQRYISVCLERIIQTPHHPLLEDELCEVFSRINKEQITEVEKDEFVLFEK